MSKLIDFRAIVDKVLKRKWKEETIKKYIGEHESSWLMYSSI